MLVIGPRGHLAWAGYRLGPKTRCSCLLAATAPFRPRSAPASSWCTENAHTHRKSLPRFASVGVMRLLSFSNSVCGQGWVMPPSVLKFKSAGLGPREVLYQGCRESPGPATNLANWTKINGLNAVQGFMATKWRIINCVGQGSRKSGVRRLRLVRLCTAGKYGKGAVSGAGVGSHSTVTRRTTDGTVRCSSSSRCTVLIALLVQQQWQAAATLRSPHVQQVGRNIQHKDTVPIVLLVWSLSSDFWYSAL